MSPTPSQITTLEELKNIERHDFVSKISYSTIDSRNDGTNFASMVPPFATSPPLDGGALRLRISYDWICVTAAVSGIMTAVQS